MYVEAPARRPLDFLEISWHPGGWSRGGNAVHPCCALRGDFYEGMRPSTRWALRTRILFATRRGLG